MLELAGPTRVLRRALAFGERAAFVLELLADLPPPRGGRAPLPRTRVFDLATRRPSLPSTTLLSLLVGGVPSMRASAYRGHVEKLPSSKRAGLTSSTVSGAAAPWMSESR